ncbi:hypothetical protein [Ferribacterium limneticum]|uniref:hypothetical protein n=1 Tax=Ferribacterium limneticum TaxID=76259 RepID=UPI001CFAB011|nr:hypothetical protein [Ferribacterium limneticum]UCV17860.1 hypothetical protein KI610_13675 [Ferribacterium limneticum]
MHTATRLAGLSKSLLNVKALEDIEFLVRESEVFTSRAGRTFVIAGADWLAYRVHWHPIGLKVERLDTAGRVLNTRHLLPAEFRPHSLMEALAVGQLSTPPLRPLG